MIDSVMFWNEPNNKSHWDQQLDPEWRTFAEMAKLAADAVAAKNPDLRRVLGGISPIDPAFIKRMGDFGVLEKLNVVAVHGFPLDWNNWMIDEWPQRLREIEAVTDLPVWVSEVGISTFGAEEVQEFGLRRTAELLIERFRDAKRVEPSRDVASQTLAGGQSGSGTASQSSPGDCSPLPHYPKVRSSTSVGMTGRTDAGARRIHWYSLYDLPTAWPATTRHREAEGSAYYRHFHMGLLREDGTPKRALRLFGEFTPELGICQWFHFEDHRLDEAVKWLRRLGVKHLRTGLSWADSFRPNAEAWFDRQMGALEEFDVTATFCFTPEHRGIAPHHTSPPLVPEEFAEFCARMTRRYAPSPTASVRTDVASAVFSGSH